MDAYDISEAFRRIENELTASMIRNMKRHRVEEIRENKEWVMWQALQLKELEKYRIRNRDRFGKQFRDINDRIGDIIREAKSMGSMEQEIAVLHTIQRGWRFPRMPEWMQQMIEETEGAGILQKIQTLIRMLKDRKNGNLTGVFFRPDDRKLEALIKAVTDDMERAETAILRKADDQYRRIVYNAQIYAGTGAGNYEQAVDMATRDMLAAGLNCVVYANGARHTLRDYADMAIRTAAKRAYLYGEGEMRQEWGIPTVIINKRGNPCPKCLPLCGKVLIDDVWSGGGKDGISPVTGIRYPLMSDAVAAGLYHPNCKDVHTTYFEGISTPPDGSYTREELDGIAGACRREERQNYVRRQVEKYDRLAEFSLDEGNREKYRRKASQWRQQTGKSDLTLKETGSIIRYKSPDAYRLNDKLRRNAGAELTEMEKEWMRNLNRALEKLPEYEGNLNRSLTFSNMEDAGKMFAGFEVGKKYVPGHYFSTTKQGIYNEDGQIQIFIQNAKHGKDLESISVMEHEVLYPPGVTFRVIEKTEHNGKYWILLEEA